MTDIMLNEDNFSEDLNFLKTHTDIVLLKNNKSAVAIAPLFQGRVMTSTTNANSGNGFGWINKKVIEKY